MPKTRAREDIIADFLKSVREPSVRNRAMLGASLNHRQLVHYEELMESAELIQRTDDGMWVSTEKGRRFVQLYEEILRSLQPMALHADAPPSPLFPPIQARLSIP